MRNYQKETSTPPAHLQSICTLLFLSNSYKLSVFIHPLCLYTLPDPLWSPSSPASLTFPFYHLFLLTCKYAETSLIKKPTLFHFTPPFIYHSSLCFAAYFLNDKTPQKNGLCLLFPGPLHLCSHPH